MTFLGGVASPGKPAEELGPGTAENRFAAGNRAEASFGKGNIGIGGTVDLDEFEVVGVGSPWSGTAIGYLSVRSGSMVTFDSPRSLHSDRSIFRASP